MPSIRPQDTQKEYVSLPWFGINKLLPYLKPYRRIIFCMIFLGLTGVGHIPDAVHQAPGHKAADTIGVAHDPGVNIAHAVQVSPEPRPPRHW